MPCSLILLTKICRTQAYRLLQDGKVLPPVRLVTTVEPAIITYGCISNSPPATILREVMPDYTCCPKFNGLL